MKTDKKLKNKAPRRSRRHPRAIWLEILFFIAMAVFGFAVVSSLWAGESVIVRLAPFLGEGRAEEGKAPGLYEALSRRPVPEPELSPIFTPSVQYWREELIKWGVKYGLDPNLLATVMQIESCGNPEARSGAGAMGLFQVMPFHFEDDEEPYDPDTNALRSAAYLAQGLERSGGHAGLALAGYNGGLGVISRNYESWPTETQRYYRWGSGIYREASAGWESSPTLDAWLAAGGRSLCDRAEEVLGIADTASRGEEGR